MTTYAHRNGETEAPTEPGRYWFTGSALCHYTGGSLHILKDVTSVITNGVELFGWVPAYDGAYEPLSAFTGQWWGPLTPPWESGQ